MKTPYAFLSMFGLLAVAASAQAADYTFKNLYCPDATSAYASGIAADGTVFGVCTDGPFIYKDGTFTTVEYPRSSTQITGVSGETVGGDYYDTYTGPSHGFIYDGSRYKSLDGPGAWWTEVDGVSRGRVVGSYFVSGGVGHGFIYAGGTLTTLDVPGASGTACTAIDGGTVAGYYSDSTNHQHGYLYDGTTFTTLDAPGAAQGPGLGTYVSAVSGGSVIGHYDTFTPGGQDFVYNSATSNFTTLAFPAAVQTAVSGVSGGLVVGTYEDTNYVIHSFIYNGSTYSALDFPGARSTGLRGICGNTAVGNYSDQSGYSHGFIVQISEPLPRISLTISNTMVIAWPYPSIGWNLQQNSDLAGTNWVIPPQTITNDGTNNFIIVNTSSGNRFFRLKQ